jgi:cytochrome c-type biogenesis protein CcmH/NrfG
VLLDRRKIKKWAKWVALILAVVFALSFLFLGVGYGGAGFNLSSIFTDKKSTTATTTITDKLKTFQTTLAANPNDVTALLGVATIYQDNQDYATAATYLERVLAADPTQKDVYLRLANLYLNAQVNNSAAAVTVLNKATAVDPNNPELYLDLGVAQNRLGQSAAAVLAWGNYLRLDPNGSQAQVVKDEIAKLTATTTTTASTSSTTGSSTTSTTGSSTTPST